MFAGDASYSFVASNATFGEGGVILCVGYGGGFLPSRFLFSCAFSRGREPEAHCGDSVVTQRLLGQITFMMAETEKKVEQQAATATSPPEGKADVATTSAQQPTAAPLLPPEHWSTIDPVSYRCHLSPARARQHILEHRSSSGQCILTACLRFRVTTVMLTRPLERM